MKKLLTILLIFPTFAFASDALDEINNFNDAQLKKREIYIKEQCANVKDAFKQFDCKMDSKDEAIEQFPVRGEKKYMMDNYYGLDESKLKSIVSDLVNDHLEIMTYTNPNDRNRNDAIDAIKAEINFIKHELLRIY